MADLVLSDTSTHSAAASALGFRYQELYALLKLWQDGSDDAVAFLETLDDVVLNTNREKFLAQLKHSLSNNPPSLTIKSVSLWKTLKVWIDVFPEVDILQTRFHLVTVADISAGSLLNILLDEDCDRSELVLALDEEARRVKDDRVRAKYEKKPSLPHSERAAGCEAFLEFPTDSKLQLLKRIRMVVNQVNVADIEDELANSLTSVIPEKRKLVAQRLIEWWGRQVLYSMCGRRSLGITRFEVVQRHMEIVSDIELDVLTNPFATKNPPSTYQADGIIKQQIDLVNGSDGQFTRAIREEWRVRKTRSLWATENPSRNDLMLKYDARLIEEWSDRHIEIRDLNNKQVTDEKLRASGRELLEWSHIKAPQELERISQSVDAAYYVRGSYQVLSITGKVGWHPNYLKLLGFDA